MKVIPYLLIILLVGCSSVPEYQYQSQANTDPTVIFGDRAGEHEITGHHQGFDVNTADAALNKCSDFTRAAFTSNNYMRLFPMAKQIRTPSGRSLAIRGSIGDPGYSCIPPTLMFAPKDGVTYGVDVALISDKCYLRVVELRGSEEGLPVAGLIVLPACK